MVVESKLIPHIEGLDPYGHGLIAQAPSIAHAVEPDPQAITIPQRVAYIELVIEVGELSESSQSEVIDPFVERASHGVFAANIRNSGVWWP